MSSDLLLFLAAAVRRRLRLSGRDLEHAGLGSHQLDLVIALPISIPAALLTMPADIMQLPAKPLLGLAYVTLFSQWIGFFAWNAGLALGGIARVSQVQLLQVFVTFALAAYFNGESITWQIVAFAAAVVATVAISTRSRAFASAVES
jgi:drug/metabolite transporter (DMT)-like permease